jgi:hypothetical protein
VAIKGGSNNAIREVHARANNSDGALGVNQSPNAEIAHCDVGGGPSGQGITKGRCIWVLATSRALIHDNWYCDNSFTITGIDTNGAIHSALFQGAQLLLPLA